LSAEVIAPTTATFAAGNNVLGFGTTMPPELAAWAPYADEPTVVPLAATVFYNTSWNPSSTSALVKFTFLATLIRTDGSIATVLGYGVTINPSVSATARIYQEFSTFYVPNGFGAGEPFSRVDFYGCDNSVLTSFLEAGSDGAGQVQVLNNANVATVRLGSNFGGTTAWPDITGYLVTTDNTGAVTGATPDNTYS
jgi:hypothetical protein